MLQKIIDYIAKLFGIRKETKAEEKKETLQMTYIRCIEDICILKEKQKRFSLDSINSYCLLY